MKQLVKLTFVNFAGPLLATFFVVEFILIMQFLWLYIDDLLGKGLQISVIGELLFYASATFVPLALPLSILLSSIMTFGKLAESYELTALKSAGVSLLRIMRPMIFFILILSGIAFLFSNYIIPRANLKYLTLLHDIRHQKPTIDINPGVFYDGIEGYSIRVMEKDKDGKTIKGITIYDHTTGGTNNITIKAKSGYMVNNDSNQSLDVILFNGARYEEMPAKGKTYTYPHNRMKFKKYKLSFDLSGFDLQRTKEEYYKDHYEMLNIGQLISHTDSLNKKYIKDDIRTKSYASPYIRYLLDSQFYKSNLQVDFKPLPKHKHIIAEVPVEERKAIVQRTINNARTLKDVLGIQRDNRSFQEKTLVRYKIEFHRKFTLSLACLTLFLIGVPLGALIRKGGIGLPTVVSIGLFVIFHILSIVGEKSAKELALSPFQGMWFATFILLPTGFYLVYRVNRDSLHISKPKIFIKISSYFARKNKALA